MVAFVNEGAASEAHRVTLVLDRTRLRWPVELALAGSGFLVSDTADAPAETMVVELAQDAPMPDEVAAFSGNLLILSDNPALFANRTLAGVLPRSATERQIAAALAAIAEGLQVRAPAGHPDTGARPVLTPREIEVLGQIGQGMSNKGIARRLGISAHTVKYHLEAVFAKLGVRSRAEAVTRGLRHGLLVV